MDTNAILGPVATLALWSMVMWVWMYATRIPAMQTAKIDLEEAARKRVLELPPEVMWVSDNYNHLMEQPTIFYAAAFAAQLAGQADATNVALAWTYVGLRIVHSLVQCTVNRIMVRFTVFALSTIALAVMAVRTALAVY